MHNAADICESGLPLTQAEQGIWLGQQLNPASPFYNAAEVLDIRGPFSASSFGLALCQALAEAPTLHRIFRETHEGARQFFAAIKPNVLVLDFSAESQPTEMAEQWMQTDLEKVVDLTQEPLYQQALIKLADHHYLWYQRIHHIAADGFAFALLSQRVAEIYNGIIGNRDTGKALADYAPALQDDINYQNSTQRNASCAFWCAKLPQSPRPVSLSRARTPVEQWPLHISTDITANTFFRLKALALSLNCNWADLITAAVAALVYQQTAANNITLGLPVMGRMGTPALRVPAMVMNITPLTVATSGLITLADWTQRVAAEQKICRPHQRYRYEHLRRDLNAVGGDKRLYGPVVNIMPFDRPLRFGDTAVHVRNLSAGPVEDISFAFVLQQDHSLQFTIEANPGRYTPQLLEEYQKRLLELLNNPDQSIQVAIDSFAWLAGAEQQKPLPSVTDLFMEQVRAQPEAIALVDGENQRSYSALYRKSTTFAENLKKHNVRPGNIVALSLPRGEAAVVSCLGCLLAGTTYVFLDPQGPAARNQRILKDAQPTFVVTSGAHNDVHTGTDYATLLDSSINASHSNPNNSEHTLAYLVYTSGSTGAPKGVMIGRRALAEFVNGAAQTYGINERDRVLQYAPLHFDASVEEIFVTLCQGATLVVRSEAMLDSVKIFLATCAQWQISVLDLPTAYWHELVYFCHSTNTPIPNSIHTVIIGGEAALPERVRQWHQLDTHHIRLLNTYGPSETTVVASCAQLQMDAAISIGTPLPGRQMAIVDRQGRIVKRNEPGELIVLGEGIGEGYKNIPKVTAERFRDLQFPWHETTQRAYFTGDRALINAQGKVEYLGRLDAEIKISGHRINPVEIESVILSLGLARDVAVVIPSGGEEKCLTAFVVPANGAEAITIQALRQQLAEFLPAPMLPTRVESLAQLPQSAAGKVDRKALAALAATDAKHAVHNDFSQEEQLVVQTWQQVLGITAINREDDFFMLGGQSLQTIQVANRLSAALQKNIAVTLLFEHPTVQQLALALSDQFSPANTSNIKEMVDADIERFQADLAPVGERPIKPPQDCNVVLLTGATGFVGAQLLHQLLLTDGAKVICLVRASSIHRAQEKIIQALAKQHLVINDLSERIDIVLADLEQPRFGLTREAFQQLGLRCDVIFHNAANTSVMRDYQSLRAANLLSTQTLLQLAAIKSIPFHLISTIAVAPNSGLPEDFVEWHKGLFDGYQQSKWAAERSVQIARERGYPAYIYRLARVVGDLQSASVNDKDLVWNIAAASARNGVFPLLAVREPWTPVDIVTKAIAACANNPLTHPVLNIMPTQAVALQDVGQWLRDAGFSLEFVNVKEWCQRLAESPHPEDRAILGFFQQRSAGGSGEIALPLIENRQTQHLLEACDIDLPEISQSHFNAYLRVAIQQQLISAPKSPTFDKRGLYEPA